MKQQEKKPSEINRNIDLAIKGAHFFIQRSLSTTRILEKRFIREIKRRKRDKKTEETFYNRVYNTRSTESQCTESKHHQEECPDKSHLLIALKFRRHIWEQLIRLSIL